MLIPHHLANKHIAVLGLGRSGLAVCRSLMHVEGVTLTVHDDLLTDIDQHIDRLLADNPTAISKPIIATPDAWAWDKLAYVVVSPGIPLRHPAPHPVAKLADKHNVSLICDIEILMQMLAQNKAQNNAQDAIKAKCIGITGTNGKSTTAALTAHLLKQAGREAILAGNIGTAVLTLDVDKNKAGAEVVLVLELSSYQLDLTPSLHLEAATILNITPDHLDRHGGWEGYVATKASIAEAVAKNGMLVLGGDQPCQEIATRHKTNVNKGKFKVQTIAPEVIEGAVLPSALTGRHNRLNAAAAVQLIMALDTGLTVADLLPHLTSFRGLPHRLELIGAWVGETQTIAFVNDSKATNAVAAAQALASFPVIYWIVGGEMKEDTLAATHPFADRVRHAYVIGSNTKKTIAALPPAVPHHTSHTLDKAVVTAFADAKNQPPAKQGEEATILLAPAAASFDQFANFEERGDCFRQLAHTLIQTSAPPTAPPTTHEEASNV